MEPLQHINLKILIILIQLVAKLYEEGLLLERKGLFYFTSSLIHTTAPFMWMGLSVLLLVFFPQVITVEILG